MTEQQAAILEQVTDLLGEHFSAYTMAVSCETEDGNFASYYTYRGNYYEALGLADMNLQTMREDAVDCDGED